MSDAAAAIPHVSEYAWHLPCPQCDAEARQPCHAPRKQARHDRVNRLLARGGHDEIAAPEYGFMHVQRVAAGVRHRSRDIGAAPWPEERVPGARYDTIDRGEHRAPVRPRFPELVLQPALVEARGRAVFGLDRDEQGGAYWPYGLENGVARAAAGDPERMARTLAHLAVARSTIVSWADHYGLKSSRRQRCCTRWLTRSTHRICRTDLVTRSRQCWNGRTTSRGWSDHLTAWTTAQGQPAALTSAPYRSCADFAAELDDLVAQDDRLAWTSGGEAWYGFHTHQVVVWRTDLLGDVDTADRIREAVLTYLP
ncbi:hypothetical protein ACFRSX_30940 [Streptomyces goshikiensis]|uniref:hypothetical protein n=1 Tax=Streptomyces TaxID=1883 RepID=UPI000C26F5F9|nr:hypothetical protein [Streptomyces sp. CB02120-2]PJN14644.1 hypothetical protein CG724_33765 [Streptomyces sp. CB02120-2]